MNGRPRPPRNGRPRPPRNGSTAKADAGEDWKQDPRRRTNTDGISDNQEATRNGVNERKK
jgi:hypothetical protein